MDYKQEDAAEKAEWIAKEIAAYEELVGRTLNNQERSRLRQMKAQEFGHWEHWEVRKDNNIGADDQ